LLLFLLLISGCAMVGPDYVKPDAPEPENWLESNEPEIQTEDTNVRDWWIVFNAPVLNDLIEAAYQQNLPLQIAGLRIYEARAQLGIAFGFQYPQTQQGAGSGSLNQISKNTPNAAASDRYYSSYDIGLDAAWELDVWGKFRRAVQSGVANLEATIADYDDILVSLTAEVARTFIVLRTSEERLKVARANVKIQRRSLEIAEVRFKAGAVTELDVTQARSLLNSTEASIPGFETDIRQAKNALAILLGKLPGEIDAMLGGSGLIPQIPAQVAVGIPAELLRRRPDIRLPNVSWPPKAPGSGLPRRICSRISHCSAPGDFRPPTRPIFAPTIPNSAIYLRQAASGIRPAAVLTGIFSTTAALPTRCGFKTPASRNWQSTTKTP
jgi:NodT family efflux transporter outer membrane factor (OMF) lipoprotein